MTDSSKSALSLISTHQGYSESEQRIRGNRFALLPQAWLWQLPQLSVFAGEGFGKPAQRGPD